MLQAIFETLWHNCCHISNVKSGAGKMDKSQAARDKVRLR